MTINMSAINMSEISNQLKEAIVADCQQSLLLNSDFSDQEYLDVCYCKTLLEYVIDNMQNGTCDVEKWKTSILEIDTEGTPRCNHIWECSNLKEVCENV